MPRPKTLPDAEVLQAAHKLMHRRGPNALTFAGLAEECGLSAATLVQRFGSKQGLIRSALAYGWDRLDEKTRAAAGAAPRSPQGAIQILTALSRDYGGIEAFADALLILREDLRDPALRARGARWKADLSQALAACFARVPAAPHDIGFLLASQWQGLVLWWGFDPRGRVEAFVADHLARFVSAVLGAAGAEGLGTARRAAETAGRPARRRRQ